MADTREQLEQWSTSSLLLFLVFGEKGICWCLIDCRYRRDRSLQRHAASTEEYALMRQMFTVILVERLNLLAT